MDFDKTGNWIKDSLGKGKDEFLRFAKISKIRIDITSLKKRKEDRIAMIGQKALEMIENGELDQKNFEPDYSVIIDTDNEIQNKENEIQCIKKYAYNNNSDIISDENINQDDNNER